MVFSLFSCRAQLGLNIVDLWFLDFICIRLSFDSLGLGLHCYWIILMVLVTCTAGVSAHRCVNLVKSG